MGLDTLPNALEVLAQPVVAKADTRVRVGLTLRCIDQSAGGFQLVDQAGKRFPLSISVRPNNLSRQEQRDAGEGGQQAPR